MKIIDSHLHFCPGYPHFDEIAIEAGHINNEEHLRECFQKYNIVGGIVMGNRGVHPDNHTYPDFLRYCVGVEARKLTPEKIQKTADVTHYVREGSPLDREALKRGTSVYLTDRVIPMLPHKLSNGICSLNQGEDRLALSCIMEINDKGVVIGHEIAETLIRVDRRMTYTAVNAIITDDDAETK